MPEQPKTIVVITEDGNKVVINEVDFDSEIHTKERTKITRKKVAKSSKSGGK